MKTVTLIKWLAGFIMCLTGILFIGKGGNSTVGAIFFLLGGVLCMPPVLPFLEAKLNTKMNGYFLFLVVTGCLVIGSLLVENHASVPERTEHVRAEPVEEAAPEQPKEPEKSPEEQLKERIERELNSEVFTKSFQVHNYRGTVEKLQQEIVLFALYARMIKEAETSNEENKKLAAALSKKVTALQASEFPKMRKEYISIIAGKLWEENIKVEVSGKGNTTITFIGGTFANNKNIKETQEALNDTFEMFRFKQVRYKWYKYDDEYQYYTVRSLGDKDLSGF